jgi:hypothetical protein
MVQNPMGCNRIYINPIDPNIHVDGFNRQAYMFIDMEKEKNQNDLVESYETTK